MDPPIQQRHLGVYFGSLGERLAEQEYPVTAAALREEFADAELEFREQTVRFADLLEPIDETFESAEDVGATLLMMVGMDAVGRKRYTDRGGASSTELDTGPDVSL